MFIAIQFGFCLERQGNALLLLFEKFIGKFQVLLPVVKH
jgi:hypothetical protein